MNERRRVPGHREAGCKLSCYCHQGAWGPATPSAIRAHGVLLLPSATRAYGVLLLPSATRAHGVLLLPSAIRVHGTYHCHQVVGFPATAIRVHGDLLQPSGCMGTCYSHQGAWAPATAIRVHGDLLQPAYPRQVPGELHVIHGPCGRQQGGQHAPEPLHGEEAGRETW